MARSTKKKPKPNAATGSVGGLTSDLAAQLQGATAKPKASASGTGPSTAGNANSDVYGLDSSGLGVVSNVVLPGANNLLGLPTSSSVTQALHGTPMLRGVKGGTLTIPATDLSAYDTVTNFLHLTGTKLAAIQQQMYQAGDIYNAGFKPTLGVLQSDDITAFKRVVLGFAVNPTQTDAQGNKLGLDGYLNQLTESGKTKGASQKSPLVIKLANPDDLRVTLQDTAQKLYGQYLPDDQVNKFIASFQAMQSSEQTAAYSAGGYNPETGQQDLSQSTQGAGATITAAPTPDAEAQTYIKTNFPNQVAATQFGNAMQSIMDTLKNPAA